MKKRNVSKRSKTFLFVLIGIFVLFLLSSEGDTQKNSMSYDYLLTCIENDEVTKVIMLSQGSEVKAELKNGTLIKVRVPSVNYFTEFVSDKVREGKKIKLEMGEVNGFTNLLKNFLSFLPTLVILYYIIKLFKGLGSKIGIGDDIVVESTYSNKLFDDIAGIDEEKRQVQEIVTFLKYPKKYEDLGARIPKGILLTGLPGTGKTLLAKAIAGEAGVPFYSFAGSSFEEKFVGVGASRIRTIFEKAKETAPCIIFIDEIDAVAKERYSGSYSEQTLNQLLTEMDGFDTNSSVIVIAATNHLEVLDSAITRPGRFDRIIHVPTPDLIAREAILKVHSANKPLANDIDLKCLAKKTIGFVGADLENILNEAAILAANRDAEEICMDDIEEAFARVVVGLEKKNSFVKPEDKRLTAVHEAGHAIVSYFLRKNVENLGISIVPRGSAGGYNLFNEEEVMFKRKSELFAEIAVLYGGRAAEEVIFNEVSTGAANDLSNATKLSQKMVSNYAMSDSLITFSMNQKNINEINLNKQEEICQAAYQNAIDIIKNNKAILINLADLLEEKEILSASEVKKFFEMSKI